MRHTKVLLPAAALALSASLVACSTAEPELPVSTPSPEQTASASPEETVSTSAAPEVEEPEEEAQRGSRENPLAPGEARKVSEASAWTVSASKTEAGEDWVRADFTIAIDWEALDDQNTAIGRESGDPVTPFWELDIVYMDKDGATYRDLPMSQAAMENYALSQGEVFPPTKSVTGTLAVEVPSDKIEGGLWVVTNVVDDRVFIAPK